VAGNVGTKQKFGDLEVVYTKEAETADRFIEKTAYEMGRKYDIKVVTSDRPVQMAALGDGAMRMSAREFFAEVMNTSEEIRTKLGKQKASKNRPFEDVF
jgi:predicted RNA-binding protein with PIN domain